MQQESGHPSERRVGFRLAISTSGPAAPVVSAFATDPTASEVGRFMGSFRIQRAVGPTTSPRTVNVTLGGSAGNSVDYETIATQHTIPAGAAWVDVPVRPLLDAVTEANESVVLTVTNGPDYTVGVNAAATVTLFDAGSIRWMTSCPFPREASGWGVPTATPTSSPCTP